MIVQLYEATQYYYYRAVLAIFPLTPDQIRAQMWPNGVRGGVSVIDHMNVCAEWRPANGCSTVQGCDRRTDHTTVASVAIAAKNEVDYFH